MIPSPPDPSNSLPTGSIEPPVQAPVEPPVPSPVQAHVESATESSTESYTESSTEQRAQAPRVPTFGFMLRHPARWLALGFGSGLSPKAPGTVGSLWGWAGFLLLYPYLTPLQWAAVIGVGLLVGWWACTATARHLGVSDPGSVVWDEILAMWIILWLLMPAGLAWQAAAFGIFRYFDAVKPGPVGWADRLFKSEPGTPIGARQGFGILFDDLVAAGCTLLVLAVARQLLH